MNPNTERVAVLLSFLMLVLAGIVPATFAESLAGFSGPSSLYPGRTYEFTYSVSGKVSGGFDAPQIFTSFYLTSRAIPTFSGEERVGVATIYAVGSPGNWFAPVGQQKVSLTIPTELTAQVWPRELRNQGCVPPGSYYLYAYTIDKTYITLPVLVPMIVLTNVTPNPARIGETVTIGGDFPNTPTKLEINGVVINSVDWRYDKLKSQIRATIPKRATATGKVLVSTALETETSPFDFELRLPDLAPSSSTDMIVSRFPKATESSRLFEGQPVYFSLQITNAGRDAASHFLTTVTVENNLGLGAIDGIAEKGQARLADIELAPLKAGDYLAQIAIDFFKDVYESNEQNNSSSVTVHIEQHPATKFLRDFFSVEDLQNPLLEASTWGDAADPDGDGLPNLGEAYFGTSPTTSTESTFFHFTWGVDPTVFEVHLKAPRPESGVTLGLLGSRTFSEWNVLVPDKDYTSRIVPTPNGDELLLRVLSGTDEAIGFLRLSFKRE